MTAVITATQPAWITPFTGLSPRCFSKLVTMLRRGGADAVRRGRPWSLPLEDRVLPRGHPGAAPRRLHRRTRNPRPRRRAPAGHDRAGADGGRGARTATPCTVLTCGALPAHGSRSRARAGGGCGTARPRPVRGRLARRRPGADQVEQDEDTETATLVTAPGRSLLIRDLPRLRVPGKITAGIQRSSLLSAVSRATLPCPSKL